MFTYENVKRVHLEVTDKCNANCPMCPRTTNGGPLNPNLRNIEMSLELAQQVFTPELLKQLEFIQLCGNFGDPIMARDTLEILKYSREVNPQIGLGLHTNGSARPASWWRELGEILSKRLDYCKFALDGLEDTNHIYRRNTNWGRIMSSVTSFIEGGGKAHWEFLVFKHNEHQVEAARQLSKEMGFESFYLKKTSRFYNYKTGSNEPFPIFNKDLETIGFLEPPTEEQNQNPATRPAAKEKTVFNIDCMSVRESSIYITAAGEVTPCCFIGGELQYAHNGEVGQRLRKLAGEKNSELTKIQANDKSVAEIVQGRWFEHIGQSWKHEKSCVHTCKLLCRKDFKIVAAEYG